MEPEIRADKSSRMIVHAAPRIWNLDVITPGPDRSRRICNVLICGAVDSATPSELVNRRETSFPASVVRALLCGSQNMSV